MRITLEYYLLSPTFNLQKKNIDCVMIHTYFLKCKISPDLVTHITSKFINIHSNCGVTVAI
jgi:hypothetical protein